MSNTVRVQALRDVQFYPPLLKGETREFSPTDARALIALGWVEQVEDVKRGPGRPKKTP